MVQQEISRLSPEAKAFIERRHQRLKKEALKKLQKYEWRQHSGTCALCGETGIVRACRYCYQPVCIQCSFQMEYDYQERICGPCTLHYQRRAEEKEGK